MAWWLQANPVLYCQGRSRHKEQNAENMGEFSDWDLNKVGLEFVYRLFGG